MKTTLLRSVLAGLALVATSFAQTWTGAVSAQWDDAANWNPATVPDNGATAVFTADGLNPTAAGSGMTNDLTLVGSHSLADIQLLAGTPRVDLYVNNTASAGSLTLTGQGLQNSSGVQQVIRLGDFYNPNPATLTFVNSATVDDFKLMGIGANLHIDFRDHSSAGQANIAAYNLDFYDDATGGNSVINVFSETTVTFHDRSTPGSAQITADFYGNIIFADSSSAGGVRIARPASFTTSGSLLFRDQSTAATADFTLYNVTFQDRASAGSAKLNNLGFQQYSSHGEYTSAFANLMFRNQTTADHATITNNAMGYLNFSDASTADHATIANTGTLTFSGQAAFADAQLTAGSGSYLVNAGYNQTAQPKATGSVLFADQATGGNGSIKIASAGAWLDFSGLYTGTGTSGRALLPTDGSATGDVVPDDASVISFGSISNTVAGGNIFLGGTTLSIGNDNSAATLSARISDVGGAYGSASGERLHGGTLIKVGTGTLTISNPDNSYGDTLITAGALRLDGGRINNATVAAAARLTGNGTVQGSLQNSGLVSPGNSPGTITVQGDFTQAANGTLAIEFASATSYDHLVVNGTANLDGTLHLSGLGGYSPVGSGTLNFLTATTVSGQFATITGLPALGTALDGQLLYTPTGVSLQVTQHPFAGFGGTSPAAIALGGHLDATLAAATGEYRDVIAQLNTLSSSAAIATALDALAPDRYSALVENAFLASATQQTARDRRLAALRASSGHGFDVFFEVGQRRSNLEAAAGLPEAKSSLAGGTAGAAWHNEGFALGATVTQEDGDLDLDDTGSRTDLKSTLPAVFFQYAADRWFVNASAAFSRDDYDLQRRVVFAGFDHTAIGTTSGTRNDFAVNAGTTFRSPSWTFTPQAGVLASRWELDRFTETGAGGANLAIFDQSISSLRTRAGFEATATGERFSPQLAVFWLHETKDDRSLSAAFAGAGNSPYAAPGRPVEADAIQASVGVDYRLGKHAVLNASVAGLWGGNARVTSDISAAFRWEF